MQVEKKQVDDNKGLETIEEQIIVDLREKKLSIESPQPLKKQNSEPHLSGSLVNTKEEGKILDEEELKRKLTTLSAPATSTSSSSISNTIQPSNYGEDNQENKDCKHFDFA